jgi:hypothetical protein
MFRRGFGDKKYGLVYMFVALFFLASYSYVDAYLTNGTDVDTLVQVSVRLIWAGGCILMTGMSAYQFLVR